MAVEYQIRNRIRKAGGLLPLHYGYPTKNLTYEVSISDPLIVSVDLRDFFSSSGTVTKDTMRTGASGFRASIHVQDWAFPRGGVVLAWRR